MDKKKKKNEIQLMCSEIKQCLKRPCQVTKRLIAVFYSTEDSIYLPLWWAGSKVRNHCMVRDMGVQPSW